MVTFTTARISQGDRPQSEACARPCHRVRCHERTQPGAEHGAGELTGLRDDVYRRPLATALARLGLGPGWCCLDVGAGGGDVSVALAEMVGREGRVYAVDSDPLARDEVARTAAAHTQVIALTQAGEDLILPEQVDLAFCRFLLLHVHDPAVVVRRMAAVVKPGSWVVAQEPITSAGRIAGAPMSMPDARHPDIGALLPSLVRDAGLEVIDAWAEAPAGVGPGPVARYLESLTGVDPGDDPVVLPPLVTVVGRRASDDAHEREPVGSHAVTRASSSSLAAATAAVDLAHRAGRAGLRHRARHPAGSTPIRSWRTTWRTPRPRGHRPGRPRLRRPR